MSIRVLFADDQLPYDRNDDANADVKKQILTEISEKLRARGLDPEEAFAEDYEWFRGLLTYMGERFSVTPYRRFAEARAAVSNRGEFDVAIVDLSYTGDGDLAPEDRHNAGLELLDILKAENDAGDKGYKPVIAFSQNFRDDPELMGVALKKGALPVPKIYNHTGYQSVSSAVEYLVAVRPPDSETVDPQVRIARLKGRTAIITTAITAGLALVGAIVAALLSAD